jgi:hypothetical protein
MFHKLLTVFLPLDCYSYEYKSHVYFLPYILIYYDDFCIIFPTV